MFWELCFSDTWSSYKNLCCGIKEIHDTFLKYYRNVVVGVSINFGGSKSNINVKPDISDNDFLGAPEIFFCEGIVYTRDGSGWIGAKIIQEAPDRTFSTGNFGGRR